MKVFAGKTAVVTGAASGIGKALALEFARRGMNVVLADIEQAALESAQAEISVVGDGCLAVLTDVSQPESVEALAEAAYGEFGAVHLLCNNAGVALGGVSIAEMTLPDWQWVMGVNLWGVIHGLGSFLPRMIAGGEGGHVVNTASMAGLMGFPTAGAYCASKFAVVGLSETLAEELHPHGIGVSVLCPFWVKTNIFSSGRNRPEELNTRRTAPDTRAIAESSPIAMLSSAQVAAQTLAAVEAERLYVFTHGETEEILGKRFGRILKEVGNIHG